MKTEKHLKLKKVVGGLYVALIIFLSLIPEIYRPKIDPTKHSMLSHFTAYFIMMLWYARIYSAKFYPRLAVIFICLGIALEFAQGYLGTREFEIIDMFFNATGVLFAWLLARARFSPATSR